MEIFVGYIRMKFIVLALFQVVDWSQKELSQFSNDDRKPFKCPSCTTTFKHRSELKKHMVVHTGERPYKCVDCGHSFTQTGNLNRHRQKCSKIRMTF